MNIIAYQIEGDISRFIYAVSKTFRIVSVMNYGGMESFLLHSKAVKLSIDVDIHKYLADITEIGYPAYCDYVIRGKAMNGDMANEFNDTHY